MSSQLIFNGTWGTGGGDSRRPNKDRTTRPEHHISDDEPGETSFVRSHLKYNGTHKPLFIFL
jgi:hypothetical protein